MRRPVIVMSLSLLFGAVYWVLDAVYDYLNFADGLRRSLFQEPLSLSDALWRNVPPDDLLSRSMFLLACLLGGATIIFFLRRGAAKDRALRASEERARCLSDAAFEAIVIHGGHRIIHANQAFERLFGFNAEGLDGDLV
ncbi:MAG: PAS domain-containing protein, partial [Desulfovibrionaceae bacterium]